MSTLVYSTTRGWPYVIVNSALAGCHMLSCLTDPRSELLCVLYELWYSFYDECAASSANDDGNDDDNLLFNVAVLEMQKTTLF